jgi:hypothetical protein
MILPSLIAGPVGGVISWFVPEPLRRFFELRREIVRLLLDCENVCRPAMIEGCLCLPEGFTEQDVARLRDALRIKAVP